MLDKTNDWNNQIFTINLIIIILILIGVIYLFINRESLLKEKESIEESEIKLKMMNESKDKFFSIIAHDLKNPFNGIMGMTSFLNESYDQIDDKERKEIISDLNISSKNAFNLLQNLLEWTRTQSGTIKNVPVKVDPASIIEMSLETVTNLARNKEIEIEQTINTTKSGYADENLVSTVLRNLFTNAVKFSPRKSTIEVSVKQYEKELVFCVKDTGIGLKHNEIDQLFRIDVNFHKKGTEEETGTGLGLKICKEFVEYCHGRIWVISEPAEGSSFYFTIPIYSE
jgi:signal transduction histidine kinase